jgi:Protein of unknown function (DUF2628)
MARYTVHVPSQPDARGEALERAVFVRDGWTWGAFTFGPLWLLWHRHWITGLIMLAITVAMLVGLAMLPASEGAKALAMLLVSFLWGLEGSSLRRLALARAGFTEEGLVAGSDLDALEQRFFAETTVPPQPTATVPASVSANPHGQTVIGLFPDPRKHS